MQCRGEAHRTSPALLQKNKQASDWVGVVVVVVVDSHIQRIVLATEETTVTQQVSHRPIKRQSRLWSQRGTKVNGSHHGDNPLLRPTGIQIATKSYAALQAMAPTNIKTVHQTSLLHSRATSIDSECCRLPTTSVLSKKPENEWVDAEFDLRGVELTRFALFYRFCFSEGKLRLQVYMLSVYSIAGTVAKK